MRQLLIWRSAETGTSRRHLRFGTESRRRMIKVGAFALPVRTQELS